MKSKDVTESKCALRSDVLSQYGMWLAAAAVVIGVVFWVVWPRHDFRKRMLARSPIDPERLLETAFPEDQIDYPEALRFLVELAGYFSVPVDRLRLEDRFAKELAPRHGWEYDDELGVIEDFLVRVARQRNIEIDTQKLLTIRDCVVVLFGRPGS